MSLLALAPVLFTGLLMGMLHAFDPDHLLTMSSLGSRPDARNVTKRYALSWGVGHGGILIIAALALLLLEFPMPETLPQGAERLVGIIMIAAGGSLALALWRNRNEEQRPLALRAKLPFLVGMVHGTAGSAAVFALLPMSLLSPMMGVVYVLVFSFGVLAGMMGFGFGFDRLTNAVGHYAQFLDKPLRSFVAVTAMAFGGYWLVSA
jgi:hypothetical protein